MARIPYQPGASVDRTDLTGNRGIVWATDPLGRPVLPLLYEHDGEGRVHLSSVPGSGWRGPWPGQR